MGDKHTPGPWLLNQYGEPVDASGEVILAKGLALTNSDEAKANSRLIAAAPELLEALKLLLAARKDFELMTAASAAETAIAKAEGRIPDIQIKGAA